MIYLILIALIIVALFIFLRPKKKHTLRPGNRALDYLLNNYPALDNKVKIHIDQLPILGDLLFEMVVKKNATDFCKMKDGSIPKKTLNDVSYAIFDLILTVYFDEIFNYLNHDKGLSSLLVDALLFQTLGQEASEITETDMINYDSYKARGIQKYLLQKQRMSDNTKIKDPSGWLLGTEVARILTDGPDIAIVMPICIASIMIRNDAKACIRLVLYDEKPDEKKRDQLLASLTKS